MADTPNKKIDVKGLVKSSLPTSKKQWIGTGAITLATSVGTFFLGRLSKKAKKTK